jgi:hypothetical protein
MQLNEVKQKLFIGVYFQAVDQNMYNVLYCYILLHIMFLTKVYTVCEHNKRMFQFDCTFNV